MALPSLPQLRTRAQAVADAWEAAFRLNNTVGMQAAELDLQRILDLLERLSGQALTRNTA